MLNKLIVPGFSVLLLTGIIQSTAFSATFSEQTLLKVKQTALATMAQQADSAGLSEPRFEAEVVRNSRPLPSCAQDVAVETADARSFSRMRFIVVCESQPGWRYDYVVRGRVSAKVVVAANDLMPGKFLSPSDVLLERHDVTGLNDSFSDLTAIEGMSTRRTVRAGDVLRQNMLVAPPLVKRGEQVKIVARREQIEVSMSGEAMDTGARGAVVRVKNASGTVIRARVLEVGTVEPADLP